jgi:hypothetical protein
MAMERFIAENKALVDTQTGLMWTQAASLFEFPMYWEEALEAVRELNRSGFCGYHDWKLPNRKELFSLISHTTINPSLPANHPFRDVFSGYYWTSTTCARLTNQAWYVHLGGARVFKGMKYGSYMVWPVRSAATPRDGMLFATGQKSCFDEGGAVVDCHGTGQDGEYQAGCRYPAIRFKEDDLVVHDHATGLTWLKDADACRHPVDWQTARDQVVAMNRRGEHGGRDWRLPNVRELESLTDMGRHSPALPAGHPFHHVQDFYWSATPSRYNPDYAWVLYMADGAVGVGHKPLPEFYLWPVRGDENLKAR